MEQRRFRFDPMWAIAAIAIGIIFTLAANVGAGESISFEFIASGAFMGICIYLANIVLHYLLSPFVGRCSASLAPSLRIGISILGGIVGWEFAYIVLIVAETGHFALPVLNARMQWFLGITIAITVLIALLAGGYNELRDHLSESIKAEQELEVARSIQSRLLPPSRIDGDGYVITARNVPAQFVAGDFYDVLRHDDGSIGIVIADVSGKGIGASLIMASVKAILPYVASGSVEQTLNALNDRLVEQLDRREFVALAYARFEPSTGKLRLGNAGMPDPYLVSSGVRAISVGGERLPLGVRRDVHYGSVELQLRPGDRLLLLSDGIPEAPRPNGEQLGYDALQATVGNVSGDAWLDNLFDRVRAQVTAVDDDWTAVLLERS
jgi:hypothetical protein